MVDVVTSSEDCDPAAKWAKPGDVRDSAFFHFPWSGVVERCVGQVIVDVNVIDSCKAPELWWEVGRQKCCADAFAEQVDHGFGHAIQG